MQNKLNLFKKKKKMVQNYNMDPERTAAEDNAEVIGLLDKCENCGLAFPECTDMRNGKQICIVQKNGTCKYIVNLYFIHDFSLSLYMHISNFKVPA